MKAVVVAGGEADARDARHLTDADLIVAADSGANWLAARNVVPAMLVGDMDSVDPAVAERFASAGARVHPSPSDKDETDTELAVAAAVAAGADDLVVLAALGGLRLDHELANILLLADDSVRSAALRLVTGDVQVRAVHAGERLTLAARVGDVVSLLPVGGPADGVVTEGLRYPLSGESLSVGRARGVSNVVVKEPAAVTIERGVLLVVEIAMGGDRDH